MLRKYKKSLKAVLYSVTFLFMLSVALQASFSLEGLAEAKKGLSIPVERAPEVEMQRPNLATLVTQDDIDHFRKNAKKVEAGSTIAETSEGVNRGRSSLLKAIKAHDGLQKKEAHHTHKVNWPLVSWGQVLSAQVSRTTALYRRDQYIANHLTHLKTEGHCVSKEEESYNITAEDLARVEEEILLAGDRLVYKQALRQKTKHVSSEINARKMALPAHRKKASAFLQELQKKPKKDKAIKVAYEIKENSDLNRWMNYWFSHRGDKKSRTFLERISSVESFETPYMVALLKLFEVQKTTLKQEVEEAYKHLLLPDYLKTLMARKNKIILEIKKCLDQGRSLRKTSSDSALQGDQMKVDAKKTYIYDMESGKYILARSGTALPRLFISMEKAVNRGWTYNSYETTLIVQGESAGYIHIDEDGSTARGFNAFQTTKTPFSSRKDIANTGLTKAATGSSIAGSPLG